MTDREAIEQKNLDGYGSEPIPWSRAREQLEADAPKTHWLATVRPDGRPHVTAVGALWVDDRFYFTAGPASRKGRNLAADAHCVVTVSLQDLDLVVEGTAARVTDEATLQRIAERYSSGEGWPARVRDGAITAEYSAPSAGPPPWNRYAVTPITAFAVATAEPSGAMRWRFAG